ncbi:MAG: SymE family type I addiction module toxin [Exilibacterium sp.]
MTTTTSSDTTTFIKRIKVNQIHYDYKPKHAPANFIMPPVPWIQLKGKWLEKVGVSIDSSVRVTVSQDCLILTIE